MNTIKHLFKIVYKNKVFILIYLIVFVGISLIFSQSIQSNNYESQKIKISFIDNDNSVYSNNFKNYLDKFCIFKEVEDPLDEMIYLHIDLEVVVKNDFLNNIKNGKEAILIKITQKNQNSYYLESIINKYNKLIYSYYNLDLGLTDDEINNLIVNNLELESEVNLLSEQKSSLAGITQFHIFLAYVILSILIYIIGNIVVVFNEKNIKKKISISGKVSSEKVSLILGLSLFSLVFALVLIILSLIFQAKLLDTNFLRFSLNIILLCFVFTPISYFIAILVKSKDSIANISTILSLVISFISGVFVPSMLLGKGVVTVSKLFPVYWYNELNNAILNQNFGKDYITGIIVLVAYGLVFLGISIYFSKKLINKENE